MWWELASAALGVGSRLSARSAEKKQVRAKREWQTYTNKQADISAAFDQGIVSVNKERARRQSVSRIQEIKINAMRAKGMAKISAAAAGVSGNTIELQALDIGRNAAEAERQVGVDIMQSAVDFEAQRDIISRRAKAAKDTSKYEGASTGETFLGIGMDLVGRGQSYYNSLS